MGSRLMHLAIARLVLAEVPAANPGRFLCGSVLPDGASSGNSHWRISCGGKLQTIDLESFRSSYEKELLTDDLVRGYYLHLLQDLFMRSYLQTHLGWKASRHEARTLHRDHTRLNAILTEKYRLEETAGLLRAQDIRVLSKEPVEFAQEKLLQSIQQDTLSKPHGKARYFTEAYADDYITLAANLSISELQALKDGRTGTDLLGITWEWGKPGFLYRVRRKLIRILWRVFT